MVRALGAHLMGILCSSCRRMIRVMGARWFARLRLCLTHAFVRVFGLGFVLLPRAVPLGDGH